MRLDKNEISALKSSLAGIQGEAYLFGDELKRLKGRLENIQH